MRAWQLQEAKAKLTELIKQAQKEPQAISRHGTREAVVLSLQQYSALTHSNTNLVDLLRNSPLNGLELEFTRDTSSARKVDL